MRTALTVRETSVARIVVVTLRRNVRSSRPSVMTTLKIRPLLIGRCVLARVGPHWRLWPGSLARRPLFRLRGASALSWRAAESPKRLSTLIRQPAHLFQRFARSLANVFAVILYPNPCCPARESKAESRADRRGFLKPGTPQRAYTTLGPADAPSVRPQPAAEPCANDWASA